MSRSVQAALILTFTCGRSIDRLTSDSNNLLRFDATESRRSDKAIDAGFSASYDVEHRQGWCPMDAKAGSVCLWMSESLSICFGKRKDEHGHTGSEVKGKVESA